MHTCIHAQRAADSHAHIQKQAFMHVYACMHACRVCNLDTAVPKKGPWKRESGRQRESENPVHVVTCLLPVFGKNSRSILAFIASARVVACLRPSTSIPAIACHIQNPEEDASHPRRGRVSLSRQSRWSNPRCGPEARALAPGTGQVDEHARVGRKKEQVSEACVAAVISMSIKSI